MLRIFTLLASIIIASQTQAEELETFRLNFTVHNPETDKKVLYGYEDFSYKKDSIEKKAYYFDLKKNLVQTEFATLSHDDKLRLMTYDFSNKLTGEMTEVKSENGKMQIKYRPANESEIKSGSMAWEKNMYHIKAFHDLILKHWQSLTKGKSFGFTLAVDDAFDSYDFNIVPKGKAKKNGKMIYTFALEADSFFVRQVAPKVETEYTFDKVKGPQLYSFLAPTSVPIGGKTGEMVTIKYSYQAKVDSH